MLYRHIHRYIGYSHNYLCFSLFLRNCRNPKLPKSLFLSLSINHYPHFLSHTLSFTHIHTQGWELVRRSQRFSRLTPATLRHRLQRRSFLRRRRCPKLNWRMAAATPRARRSSMKTRWILSLVVSAICSMIR